MEIKVYSIVFIQKEDEIHNLTKEINRSLPKTERARYFSDFTDRQLIDYLKQWHEDDLHCYDCNTHDIDDLNTPFLGHVVDAEEDESEGYLFARNNGLEYAGLSYFVKETN